MIRSILRRLAGAMLAVLAGGTIYLLLAPPELLRVADGYAAKIVCSNVFVAGRDAEATLATDVQAPGHPLLRLVRVRVDRDEGVVTARLLGLFATGIAIHRPGLGCTTVPDGDIAAARRMALPEPTVPLAPGEAMWPAGARVETAATPAIADIFATPALIGPDMRAVVVVKNGKLLAEAYGPGFDSGTPLLGWSMTKTVNAALLARAMAAAGKGLDAAGLFPQWAGDERAGIRVADLMAMTGGLAFDEEYGDVSDVNRMLFLEPDMAAFAAARPAVAAPGRLFNYSSGTAVLLSRLWMSWLGDEAGALAYPRTALFDPLGMASAVLEADAAGTLVGSSYMYATARDWARFGLFLLQDGVWNGERLLPEGFVALMRASNGKPGGYSQAQSWVLGPRESDGAAPAGLPPDTFWMAGHDGQSVAIIPSAGLVVVRLGLTPSALGYGPEALVRAILDATG